MINKKILIEEILDFIGKDKLNVVGPTDGMFIDNLADVDRVNETTLDWINPAKANKQEIALNTKAKVLSLEWGRSGNDWEEYLDAQTRYYGKLVNTERAEGFFVEKYLL